MSEAPQTPRSPDRDAVPDQQPSRVRGGVWRALSLAAVLAAVWLYVWGHADTSLLYHSDRKAQWFPAPPRTCVFESCSVTRPGGPVAYAGAWLSQLYYYPVVGAATLTGAAGLLALASAGYLSATLRHRPQVLHLLPALLVALPLARYGNPLAAALAVLAATTAAWAYAALTPRRMLLRATAFLLLSGACWWVAGAAVLLFVVLSALHETLAHRWAMASLALVAGGLTPLAGAHVQGVPIAYGYSRLLFVDPTLDPGPVLLLVPLYLGLPFAVAAVAAIRRTGGRGVRSPFPAAGGFALLFCVWAAGLFALDDPQLRAVMRLDRAVGLGEWEQAVEQAGLLELRRFDHMVLWDLNRALCRAGRLGDEMFGYPQSSTSLMPMPADLHPGFTRPGLGVLPRAAYLKCLNAMYDLGRLNEAEMIAHEAWEMIGQHPGVMRRLVAVNVAKDQPEAAAAFLHSMQRDPVWGRWARDMLRRLREDPRLTGDPEIERLRRSRDVPNARSYLSMEQSFLDLLEADPGNRMAFDCLMAHYLLTRRLDRFVAELPRMRSVGYSRLPQHYAEALQLFRLLTMQAARLPGYGVSDETKKRTDEFLAVVKSYGRDREGARRALVSEHRGTYPFYFVFAQLQE